jgi:hypothetical protein
VGFKQDPWPPGEYSMILFGALRHPPQSGISFLTDSKLTPQATAPNRRTASAHSWGCFSEVITSSGQVSEKYTGGPTRNLKRSAGFASLICL